MPRIPVAEGIFTWPSDDPQLLGSRCTRCGIEMAEHALARRGRLWAWTTQEFPPPSPPYTGPTGEDFVPYGVGYVELGGEVRVESRLTETEGLANGMEMELVLVPFRTDDAGNEVVTFAFRPVR